MLEFRQYLEWYLKQKGLLVGTAAKFCGINRVTLKRYITGERLPQNQKIVERIAHGIGMSDEQTKQLCRLYQGKKRRETDNDGSFDLIKQLYDSVPPLPDEQLPGRGREYHFLQNQQLHGKSDIMQAAAYIMESARHIWVKAFPICDELYKMLEQILRTRRISGIHQIIQLSEQKKEISRTSMQIFTQMYPLLVYAETSKLSYYYGEMSNISPGQGLDVNVMITETGMVLFDSRMENGLFSSQEECRDCYLQNYKRMESACGILAENGSDEMFDSHCKDSRYFIQNAKSKTAFAYDEKRHEIWIQNQVGRRKNICIKEPWFVYGFRQFIIEYQAMDADLRTTFYDRKRG